jgi:F-type H+-transporting ATPase subunit b
VNNLLRKAREDHKNAVQERIETIGQLGDIVDVTKALFAMSKVLLINVKKFFFPILY